MLLGQCYGKDSSILAGRIASFDDIAGGYAGPLYLEIAPQTFSVLARAGTRLNQLRLRRGDPPALRVRFRDAHVSIDTMTTGAAVRTYNVMLMESRRVGAGLIAV